MYYIPAFIGLLSLLQTATASPTVKRDSPSSLTSVSSSQPTAGFLLASLDSGAPGVTYEIIPHDRSDCPTIVQNKAKWHGTATAYDMLNTPPNPVFSLLEKVGYFSISYQSGDDYANFCDITISDFTFVKNETTNQWQWSDTDYNNGGSCVDISGSPTVSCNYDNKQYTATGLLACIDNSNPSYCNNPSS